MWPFTSSDLKVEALIDGTWTEVTTVVRENSGIVINRGRGDERARLTSQRCNLTIDNRSGDYNNRNPSSPYFGKLGRNTQLRVKVAAAIGAATTQTSGSTSHVAPSVDLDADAGLLICVWMGFDLGGSFNYTIPGSMTAGTETDGSISTSRSGRETLASSGATGTRTATASATIDNGMNVVSLALPGTITAQEVLQNDAYQDVVTLTTDAGTQAGWWMIAVQGWVVESGDMNDPPTGGGWTPLADTGSDGTGRMRAWAKPVLTAGAQTVTFPAPTTFDNHAHLFVLSGMDGLPPQSAYRFWGEVPHWPLQWDKSGNDVTAPIEASGPLRRLTRPGAPLRSALFRAATSADSKPLLLGYWPLEDGTDASQFASGIGGNAMVYAVEAPTAASVEVFYGSGPIAQFGADTRMSGTFTGTDTGTIAARLLLSFPAGGTIADGTKLLHVNQTGSTVRRWQILYGTGGTLNLRALNSSGTVLDSTGAIAFNVDSAEVLLGFNVAQSGSDVAWTLFTRTINANGTLTTGTSSGTFTGLEVGVSEAIVIGPAGGLTSLAVGHVMVGDSTSLASTLDDAIVGHIGETAAARITRLCGEEGVDVTTIGDSLDSDDSAAMGPQGIATLGTLLFDCRDADQGILYERRDAFGLAYRLRADLDLQATDATLTYASSHVADIRPQDDDQYLANDITVSRVDGSSARYTLETGALSILDPPDGVGQYPMSTSINVESDTQLADIVGWLGRLGTWDEARYPLLATNLARLSSNTSLAAQVLGLDLGDRLAVDHNLDFLPPDDIEVLVQGYVERIFTSQLYIGWNTSPAKPYDVGILADTSGDTDELLGWLEFDSCELVTAVDTDDTSWSVTTIPADTNDTDDFPRDHYIGGELVTVTASAVRISDAFSRNETDTWGTSTSGHTYTYQGTQADYDVTTAPFGHGTIQPTTLATDYTATIDCGSPDADLIADFSLNTLPASGSMGFGLVARGTDTSNRYMGRVLVATTGLVTLELHKRVAGTGTTESQTTGLTLATGTKYRVRFQCVGNDLTVKVWLASGSEQVARSFSTTFTDLTTGNRVGVYTRNNTAATTHVVSVDDLEVSTARTWTVTRNVNGITGGKSHSAGAEITLANPLVLSL